MVVRSVAVDRIMIVDPFKFRGSLYVTTPNFSLIVPYIRKFDTSRLFTFFIEIIHWVQENPFLSQAMFNIFSTTSMAASSSVEEQMAQSTLLCIMAN